MSEIECVNLLAFIQFTIAFDFGLYYLDDKHALTKNISQIPDGFKGIGTSDIATCR